MTARADAAPISIGSAGARSGGGRRDETLPGKSCWVCAWNKQQRLRSHRKFQLTEPTHTGRPGRPGQATAGSRASAFPIPVSARGGIGVDPERRLPMAGGFRQLTGDVDETTRQVEKCAWTAHRLSLEYTVSRWECRMGVPAITDV